MLSTIEKYYTEKINKHGPTPNGVDWNGQESQYLRFKILSDVIEEQNSSILDYGCGYGAFYSYLKENNIKVNFTGFDISTDMLKQASKIHNDGVWISELDNTKYDYIIASGIFNVFLNNSKEEWEQHIINTINIFNNKSTKGFAFNMLTTYSDADKARDYLYYAEPEKMFQFCKNNISKKVLLNHSYPLYEFTIVVKK